MALLVFLADAHRLIGGAVEFFTHLHFDERPLLFNDNDKIEPLCKLGQLLPRNWPDATDLEQTQAEVVAFDFVDAEFVERLPHVEIRLTRRDDADLRVASARGNI